MINDKKAPRCRPNKKVTLDNNFFEYLFEKEPVLRYKYSKKQIKDIVKTYNTIAGEYVLDYRYGVEIPIINKNVYLAGYKPIDKPSTNYIQSYYNGKSDATEFNLHTDGYSLKIVCATLMNRQRVYNLDLYKFRCYRSLRVAASKRFAKDYTKYFILDVKAKNKRINLSVDKEDLTNYNELEI
jgi:hypothetical protein